MMMIVETDHSTIAFLPASTCWQAEVRGKDGKENKPSFRMVRRCAAWLARARPCQRNPKFGKHGLSRNTLPIAPFTTGKRLAVVFIKKFLQVISSHQILPSCAYCEREELLFEPGVNSIGVEIEFVSNFPHRYVVRIYPCPVFSSHNFLHTLQYKYITLPKYLSNFSAS